jgi:hypothetical protein
MQRNTGEPMGQVEMQQCIQDCLDCHAVCMKTADACRQAGGEHGTREHVYLLLDCAEICLTAAHFMQHDSPLCGYIWEATARVTDHTSNECARMGDDECANACRTASWSCDQMAKLI